MVIEVILKTGKEERRVRALVDSGVQANCIQRKLALQMDLTKLKDGITQLASPEGQRIYSYGDHLVRIDATDTLGDRRGADVRFVSCDFDLGDVDVILDYPWLVQVNPSILFGEGTWKYTFRKEELKVLSAKEFVRALKDEKHVFVLTRVPTGVRRVGAMATKGSVPEEFQDIVRVFSKEAAGILPNHHSIEHKIDLEPGTKPLYGPIYTLSEKELEVLREYLETSEEKGWIRRSTSETGAPIMFVPKKGGGLRLCVDYRGLNRITIKNRTPLPLISETLDRLRHAERFTKLDLKDAYHRLRIREGDK